MPLIGLARDLVSKGPMRRIEDRFESENCGREKWEASEGNSGELYIPVESVVSQERSTFLLLQDIVATVQ